MQETLLKSDQAAAVLGVHVKTVLRWCRGGKLQGAYLENKSRKLGWRIPKQAIVELRNQEYFSEGA